jgi:hypothetical protein
LTLSYSPFPIPRKTKAKEKVKIEDPSSEVESEDQPCSPTPLYVFVMMSKCYLLTAPAKRNVKGKNTGVSNSEVESDAHSVAESYEYSVKLVNLVDVHIQRRGPKGRGRGYVWGDVS